MIDYSDGLIALLSCLKVLLIDAHSWYLSHTALKKTNFPICPKSLGDDWTLPSKIPNQTKPEEPSGAPVTAASTEGALALSQVQFTYPSRPDLQVMNGYELDVKAGMTVGLVGQSGSGKSTAIQLVERFYDPDGGAVKLDGTSLTEVNYKDLHRVEGFVGQVSQLVN